MELADALVVAVLAVLAIVTVTALAPRVGVAAPLVLVLVGIAISFVPAVPPVDIDPEWVLAGVLPPLLYSSAVSMPAMDFRRDFRAIGGLSVVLVALSSVLLGLLFVALVPGLGLATGIALGAIVSPTDAVATTMVKRLGVSPRVVTVLEGESMLNDASALVLLRSAIAATAGAVSIAGVVGDFAFAVAVAVVLGALVGLANLRVRSWLRHAAAGTAVSFVAPFVAYLPAEHLGASGLVAAVTAGIVTGQGSARFLRPQDRLSEETNWRTVELLLEGGVFLLLGLELFALVDDVVQAGGSVGHAVGLGALAALVIVLVRAAYVAPFLALLQRRARRKTEQMRQWAPHAHARLAAVPEAHRDRWRIRMRQRFADVDYLERAPLGVREGTVIVWAGMRGVVTLAAAQTLPRDTPQRSFLILVAVTVAIGTLLVQGGTLPWVVRRLGLQGAHGADEEERAQLLQTMNRAGVELLERPTLRRPGGGAYDPLVVAGMREVLARGADEERQPRVRATQDQLLELRLAVIEAQREALLQARFEGTYSSAALTSALAVLDADQLSAELKGGSAAVSELEDPDEAG